MADVREQSPCAFLPTKLYCQIREHEALTQSTKYRSTLSDNNCTLNACSVYLFTIFLSINQLIYLSFVCMYSVRVCINTTSIVVANYSLCA